MLPRSIIRSAFALFAALWLGACGMTEARWQLHRDLLDADRLADDGAFDAAFDAYMDLAPRVDRDDLLLYVRYRLGLMLEKQGRYEEALEAYAAAYTRPYNLYDHTAGQALFRTAEIYRNALGDEATAVELYQTVIRTFPNTFFADDALYELIDYWRRRGESRTLYAFLTTHYLALQRTEIADNLAYWTGRVLQDDLESPAEAIRVYEILILNFHPSGLVDDSVWRTALCYRTLGEIDAEYRLLSAFLDVREVSWIMADYESEYYVPSLNRMAEIHEERGELREAIAVYERFVQMYKLSLRRDDVQFHVMELQAELGDVEGMRESLAWIEREYPRSRYIARGASLLASVVGP